MTAPRALRTAVTRLFAPAFAVLLTTGLLGTVPAHAGFAHVTRTTAQVTAAADWTPPSVEVVPPGSVVKGTVALGVTARDPETGVARVVVETLAPNASEWTTLCTRTATSAADAPADTGWGCSWQTVGAVEGQYLIRATAVDRTGLETVSETVTVRVANKLAVFLEHPGDAVRGTVTLQAGVQNVGTATHSVRIEYAPADTTTWRTVCTGLKAPYSCAWNTTAVASDAYDLRAVLTVGSTTTVSEDAVEVEVDNVAPSVTLGDPGQVLSGAVTFAATATDVHSGVEQVVLQRAAEGSGVWSDLCVRTEEPWSCRVDTTTIADGRSSFRAVATDAAGNTATSAVVGPRTVDNSISSVVVDVPSTLAGTVTVGAVASARSGVAQVAVEVAPAGTSTWTRLCVDAGAPFSCLWDTTSVPDGAYDLRAVMVDGLGRTTTSAVSRDHLVNNSPLRGVDVQAVNGGALSGRPGSGDTVTYTFSSEIRPSSVLAGWNGSSRAVVLRLRDGALLGRSSKEDGFDVVTGTNANAAAVNLGQVNLKADRVRTNRTTLVNATMTASTVTAGDGTVRGVVTLRLGTIASGSSRLRTSSTTSTMLWTPSTLVTDLQGRACAPATVTESGAKDKEF